jgi:hypothetical protein
VNAARRTSTIGRGSSQKTKTKNQPAEGPEAQRFRPFCVSTQTKKTKEMNTLIEGPVAAQKPPKGMLLHCGAELVSRAQLCEVPTPQNTSTWYPLPHSRVYREVLDQLEGCGFLVTEEAHALSHDGARYFGVLNITLLGRGIFEWSWAVGIRNSHDKTFPAATVSRSEGNLCFF